MVHFGLISEGETDHAVLENILIGYYNQDISGYINQLQPLPNQSGGWSRVFKYCTSSDFKNDFDTNDFMVIQVDTDRSFEKGFDVEHEINGQKLSVEQLAEKVKERFVNLFKEYFGDTFLSDFGNRILFAITVHSTECWLLPLYYKANKEKSEFKNCYQKLNEKQKGLRKTYSFYDTISSDFRNPKKLNQAYPENPSFKIFIEKELKAKVPLQKEENTEGV